MCPDVPHVRSGRYAPPVGDPLAGRACAGTPLEAVRPAQAACHTRGHPLYQGHSPAQDHPLTQDIPLPKTMYPGAGPVPSANPILSADPIPRVDPIPRMDPVGEVSLTER